MRRPLVPAVSLLLLLLGLVTPALAAPAPAGHEGVDAQGTHQGLAVGPAVPGAEYLEVLEELDAGDRERRLVADSVGHLLVQGRDPAEPAVHRLLAADRNDGSTDWTLDDVTRDCIPVATDDGRIFAQLVPNSPTAGVDNFSADPVEIDAATGTITDQYTPADDATDPRIRSCFGSLRLGVDDTLLVLHRAQSGTQVVAFRTDPLEPAWRHTYEGSRSQTDHPVLSPDGRFLYVGGSNADNDPLLERIDVTTGNVETSQVMPGGIFTNILVHTGDLVIVSTGPAGGQDFPPRILALDPETLAERWRIEAREELDLGNGVRAAVADGVLATFDSRRVRGFDLANGSLVWEVRPGSFSNNGNQIITDAAGNVYWSTFGGPALESVTAQGERRFAMAGADLLGEGVAGEAQGLGPVLADGRLYGLWGTGDEMVLAAVGSGTERLDAGGGGPTDVAIEICRYLFDDDAARTVVLARDDVFADALAGAPLAGDHSCILFTPGGPAAPLSPDTAAEIDRVLPAGATVRIAGGSQAVSVTAEQELRDRGYAVERLFGAGRIDTAVEIARVVVAENGRSGRALLAFDGNWPDAVTGGARGAFAGVPILLTSTAQLSPQTAQAMADLGVTETTVLGGTAVISEAAAGAAPGATRVSGPNRFATAAQIAAQLWDDVDPVEAVVLANLETGEGWNLALAASPLSARLGAPQIGIAQGRYPQESSSFLTSRGFDTPPGVVAVGGVSVISDEVVEQVAADVRR